MGTEIERKFLVSSDALSEIDATHQVALRQGYLSSEPGRTVRVRLQNEQGYLTIKGKARGFARPEFEYPIPQEDAEALLALCRGPLIEKWRHYVEYAGKVWEVDEFFGDNAGLVVAELELDREDETFERPDWIGEEVTLDPRYHNSRLAERPYKEWAHEVGSTTPDSSAAAPASTTTGSLAATRESGEAPNAPFVLVLELYVRPHEEKAFRRYEDTVLRILARHGLELRSRIAHSETAQGELAPFETHIIVVPSEAALLSYETDPERARLSAERDRLVIRSVARRGAFF